MNKISLVLGFVALVLAGVAFSRPAQEIIKSGAVSGPGHSQRQEFWQSFSQGGIATISTTSATYTLKDSEMSDSAVISIASLPTSAALTLTLPASSTWSSLAPNGTSQKWIVDNLHTAAATTSTITAGTGVDLDGPTTNDDVLNGGVSGLLECWRLPNSDVRCIIEEMVDAG